MDRFLGFSGARLRRVLPNMRNLLETNQIIVDKKNRSIADMTNVYMYIYICMYILNLSEHHIFGLFP